MKTGIIKFFNTAKGYGFIKEDGTGNTIFVHHTGLLDPSVSMGDQVSFELSEGPKGPLAIQVKKT